MSTVATLDHPLFCCVPAGHHSDIELSKHDITGAVALFLTAEGAVLRGPLDLSPWLYCIPGDLQPFKRLLVDLGVRESFTADQYVRVLTDMAAASGKEPLSAAQQEQAISVLQVGAIAVAVCKTCKLSVATGGSRTQVN